MPQALSRSAWLTRDTWLKVAIGVSVLLVLGSAVLHRFTGIDRLLWGSDELATLLPGMRLHLLPWFNLGDPVRENFFKSLVMPVHGLGDTVFFYLVVAVFRTLDLSLTEANLFRAAATLSVASLGLLFVFVRRLFGVGAALVALSLGAWNTYLIALAKTGFQITFIVFLQIAVLYGYLQHVSQNRWSTSVLVSALMILCAGSELFYLAPILLGLHWAYRRTVTRGEHVLSSESRGTSVGFCDQKNLLVWGGYGLMFLVNVFLFFKVGRQLDLTLFGHLFMKGSLNAQWFPDYGLRTLLDGINGLMPFVPGFAYVAFAAAAFVLIRHRRAPLAVFFAGYFLLMTALMYLGKVGHGFNLVHLLVPAFIVIGVAVVDLVATLFQRRGRSRQVSGALAGLTAFAVLIPVARPWQPRETMQPPIPEPYRCVKAVGSAVRELGHPGMHVMVLSNHAFIPTSLEYYLGLTASTGDNEPTQLFYVRDTTDAYLPSHLAQRLGIGHFDYYVDLVKEAFPSKERFLADLHTTGVHEVAQIVFDGEVFARVYSPEAVEPRTISLETAEQGFDRRYAKWNNLFHNVNVGTFWYFGANY